MIDRKEIGMCGLCGTKYDLVHTFCVKDGHQLEQKTLLTYNGKEFTSYLKLDAELQMDHISSRILNYTDLRDSIKDGIKEEKHYESIKYWGNLNTNFKKSHEVPLLNLRGMDHINYTIPALIRCGCIPKNELIDGHFYYGNYRNSDIGMWIEKDNQFEIYRTSWGQFYTDRCNHFENDDGLSLFIPLKEVTEEEYNNTKQ